MSRRCRTMTSLASLNTGLPKAIVDAGLRGELCGEQGRETQKGVPTQMRTLRHPHRRGIGRQHPHRNLQSSPSWVDDAYRAVSQFGSTDDTKAQVMKRVESVEDSDVGGFCAQGSVGAGGIIPTSTASCRWAVSPRTGPGGSTPGPASSFRFPCCGRFIGASSSPVSARRVARAASPFPASSLRWRPSRPSVRFSDPSTAKPGWSMRSHLWQPGTRAALPSRGGDGRQPNRKPIKLGCGSGPIAAATRAGIQSFLDARLGRQRREFVNTLTTFRG
jgi:hypothetical protein